MISDKIFEVELRNKNQMTLPAKLTSKLGLKAGDRLLMEVRDDGRIELRPLLRSYEGIFAGLFKDSEDIANYLREERASWDE